MKKVNLMGLDIEVEFDEREIAQQENSDGEMVDTVVTACGRLIGWDDGANSWTQWARWA